MTDRYFKKAFDVGDIPDDIDLSVPPVTGFDYLYRVRLETKKCPKVVVATIDTSKYLSRQTVRVDACNGFIRARPGFEPDPTWLEEQLESFQLNRGKLSEDREILMQKFPKQVHPKITRIEDWCMFCLGSDIHDQIYVTNTTQSEESNIAAPKAKKSRLCCTGNPPLLSIVLYFNQSRVTKMLSYHIRWLESSTNFSHLQGQWLYALLVCLEKPLEPDTCSLLRSLSRLCSKLRNNLSSPADEFLKPLNLILCIVAHYFDQKDMSDSFSDNKSD